MSRDCALNQMGAVVSYRRVDPQETLDSLLSMLSGTGQLHHPLTVSRVRAILQDGRDPKHEEVLLSAVPRRGGDSVLDLIRGSVRRLLEEIDEHHTGSSVNNGVHISPPDSVSSSFDTQSPKSLANHQSIVSHPPLPEGQSHDSAAETDPILFLTSWIKSSPYRSMGERIINVVSNTLKSFTRSNRRFMELQTKNPELWQCIARIAIESCVTSFNPTHSQDFCNYLQKTLSAVLFKVANGSIDPMQPPKEVLSLVYKNDVFRRNMPDTESSSALLQLATQRGVDTDGVEHREIVRGLIASYYFFLTACQRERFTEIRKVLPKGATIAQFLQSAAFRPAFDFFWHYEGVTDVKAALLRTIEREFDAALEKHA